MRNPRNYLLILFIIIVAGCNRYYKAVTVAPQRNAYVMDSLQNTNRYFVYRQGSSAYAMKQIVINNADSTVSFRAEKLPENHLLHLTKGRDGKMKYDKQWSESLTTNEVHFYTNSKTPVVVDQVMQMPLDSILKIEILEHDKSRTTSSYIAGGLLIGLGVFTVVGLVVLATKSSCPFVSGFDGESHVLQGELFGGAIYPQLARNDYIPLKLGKTPEGNYEVIISNELKEKQFTDLADLWVIHHDKNSRVIADENGNLHSIGTTQVPVSARLVNHPNPSEMIAAANDNKVLYFGDTSTKDGTNELFVQFKKPAGLQKGKLILKIKNSYFLDYLYGDMASAFGRHYNRFMKKQEKKPAAELNKWVEEQNIPLEVAIKAHTGWKRQALLSTIGPLEFREVVVPLEFENAGDEMFELRFRTGFMFWEIDAVGVDFSSSQNFTVEKIKPSVALDEKGNDVRSSLLESDQVFLEQPQIGNMATLVYKPSAEKTEARSFILHTKGYYQHIRDYKGSANVKFLKQFQKPNAFALYGIKRFLEFRKNEVNNVAKISKK